ncbi:hypothetical protein [Paraburkholderia fungorum]
MAINGVESVIYGVDDVALCTRYFDDFGLAPYDRDESAPFPWTHYQLPEGSNVILRRIDDPALPQKHSMAGTGVVETIWGVDTRANLDRLVKDLSRDHELTFDADGTVHFVTAFGMALGLRVFVKTPVFTAPDPVNSPGNVNRLNVHRKWKTRARPKTIQHVVFATPDMAASFQFFRDRLHFRLSDIQRGFGIFARADGALDHHNIYFLNANLGMPGLDGKFRFNHVNYGVEDIDEVAIGLNYMERKGWPKSVWGLGRHRIASSVFCYLPCPTGGEAEYGADSDCLDDNWVPRTWDPLFGTAIFMHNLQPWIKDTPVWDVDFVESHVPSYPDGHPNVRSPRATDPVTAAVIAGRGSSDTQHGPVSVEPSETE